MAYQNRSSAKSQQTDPVINMQDRFPNGRPHESQRVSGLHRGIPTVSIGSISRYQEAFAAKATKRAAYQEDIA